jgi:hypothetical protein
MPLTAKIRGHHPDWIRAMNHYKNLLEVLDDFPASVQVAQLGTLDKYS